MSIRKGCWLVRKLIYYNATCMKVYSEMDQEMFAYITYHTYNVFLFVHVLVETK